ncbi:MAG: HAD family hydrolase [Ktedonobacteraceae bacterium]
MNSLIIFDLDGVITSEEAYWDAAGLTLHELLYSPHYWNLSGEKHYHPATTANESRSVSRSVFPEAEILALKARAINSNWDTCYATACLHLINLLVFLKEHLHTIPQHLVPLQPWEPDWIVAFRNQFSDNQLYTLWQSQHTYPPIDELFSSPPFPGYVGLELINRFDTYASELLDMPITRVFSRYSPFWSCCRDIFQEWYLGDDLYTQTYGHAPAQSGKPGCIHFEHPLLPSEQERATLQTLLEQDYTLGFATGRVRQEAEYPLKMYNLLSYFDDQHISTYDDVERAESVLRNRGAQTLLSKPHPFPFLFAADHHYQQTILQNPTSTNNHPPFIIVGDSTSDILSGSVAGALTIAVLTGARTPEARELLAQSKPDFTIEDMTKLPAFLADIDSLATIQKLQFTEREKAERLLQLWFARHMYMKVDSINLTPRAVSLNSFNGFYRLNNEEYFFKTHVEEQGILEEYYHAELLHRSGYNIVLPLQTLHEKDQQMVIYPVIHWPVMFDLVRAIENGDTGNVGDNTVETLTDAEQQECHRLLKIYASTLEFSTDEENARAPIHQLFWHRLTGGRFQTFYTGKQVPLPGNHSSQSPKSSIPFDELLAYQWTINGVPQQKTLGELVERAMKLLHPAQSTSTIIGHGDAHFGNIFLEIIKEPGYLYFDPAFAGRHSPLLDIIKPLFHNIFATWMYFPHDIAQNLQLSVTIKNRNVYIEHNYALTPIRQAILQVKIQQLLAPLIALLRSQNALPDDWLEFMQLALMCCPLLTVNLLDAQRMPAIITWLGLSQAIQVGNTGIETF